MDRVHLVGKQIALRPLADDDLQPVVNSVMRWVTDGSTESTVRENMRQRIRWSGTLSARELLLGIESDGRLIGDIQARADQLPRGVFELGIFLFEEADRGRGHGREAVALLAAHLFEEERAHRVQLSTDVANDAMRRVVEGLGFSFEGILRGFWPEPDGPHDYAMYGMTRMDFEKVKDAWTSTN